MSKLMHKTILVPALGLALATLTSLACDPGEGETPEPRAGSLTTDLTTDIDPTPQHVASEADRAPAPSGSLAEQIASLQPRMTRAGWPRFSDPVINQPEAAPLLLDRLRAGQDSPEVRAALAEAVARTGADYAAEVSELLASEADPRVREMLVGGLGRRADNEAAVPGLLLGLQDAEPTVRAATLRSIGARSDGARFGEAMIAALADADAKVRSDAARSLGVLGIADAVAPLTALLGDADPEVRLHGLRAIDRIDPAAAAQLGSLASLEQDPDARVQRLATSIRTR